jgi:Domain of unknown function (DUF4434)
MHRRTFLYTAGVSALSVAFHDPLTAAVRQNKKIKPIEGSWFEFQHISAVEGTPWNATLEKFTVQQWEAKVKELAGAGLRDLVLVNIAGYGKTFYPSSLMPQHKLGCEDPLEAVLSAADRYGVRFFVSNGFFGDWTQAGFLMRDPEVHKLRVKAMAEVAEKYARHQSFYGWYYPNELGIQGHFTDFFINYVNASSAEARRLTPKAKTLIAPYGTRNVQADDEFVRQLEQLDVDYVAYQDEVGVEKTKVEESAAFYERLHNLHKKAGRSRLWADVEVFRFAGKVYGSALLPAPAERVIRQLEAVSPYVEKILIFEYPGLINKPGSPAFAGPAESVELFEGLAKHGYLRD